MIQEGWNIVWTAVEWYFSNGSIWILLLCAVAFSLFKRKDQKFNFWGWYIISYSVIVLNPISAIVLSKLGLDGVYWRVFWMLPIGCMIAYMFTQVVSIADKRFFRGILVGISIIVFGLCGKFIYTSENFQIAENLYKIPQEVIEVSNCIEPGNAVIAPIDVLIWLRTYNADIYMPIGRQAYFFEGNVEKNKLIESISDPTMTDVEYIVTGAMNYGCRYIVIEKNRQMEGSWEDYGYYLVDQTEKYLIYRR